MGEKTLTPEEKEELAKQGINVKTARVTHGKITIRVG